MWKGGKTDEQLGREIVETIKQDAKLTPSAKCFLISAALGLAFLLGYVAALALLRIA